MQQKGAASVAAHRRSACAHGGLLEGAASCGDQVARRQVSGAPRFSSLLNKLALSPLVKGEGSGCNLIKVARGMGDEVADSRIRSCCASVQTCKGSVFGTGVVSQTDVQVKEALDVVRF